MRPSVDLRDDFRVKLSSRREEYVSADVRAFFHSIYTHAIPWAIHGKSFAKKNRGMGEYGNLIDLLCRNAQGGQTIGLPVGPDTSRLVAELVASAMDEHLQQKLNIGGRDASRYIDDYTISSPEGANGQELLAAIRQSAAFFELELNNEKSAIYPTSHRQSVGWQQAALEHRPRPAAGETVETGALQHFFYSLGRVCLAHPEINVEKFGLQHARSALVHAKDWGAAQFSLINAYRRNSSLVSLLVETCLLRQAAHSDVDKEVMREFIEGRVYVLARANRTGEIIWLLFLAIRLNLRLGAKHISPLFAIENAFVALLVVCLHSMGLISGGIDRALWDKSLSADGLRSSMWLYAYEAVTQGFLPNVDDEFIRADPYFGLLRQRRIQFLDLSRGYASLSETLRNLRNENEHLRRFYQMRGDENFYNVEDDDEDEDGDEGAEDSFDLTDLY